MLNDPEGPKHLRTSILTGALAWAALARVLDFSALRSDPESAILVVVWGVTALLLLWLGASVAYWRSRLAEPNRGSRWLDLASLPGSRQIAQTLFAASLTVLPACASSGDAPRLVYLGEVAPTTTNLPQVSDTRTATTTEPPQVSDARTDTTTEPPQVSDTRTEDTRAAATQHHVVIAGDHLWGIAAATVRAEVERTPTTTEVAQYWAKLVAANRNNLTSQDPNLIYPGETLTLP